MAYEAILVKFFSIRDKLSPRDFLGDIRLKLKLDYNDFKDITTIHMQKNKNQQYHLRVLIKNKEIFNDLLRAGKLNRDKQAYTLRLGDYSVIFQTQRQSGERFEIAKLEENDNKMVLMIKKLKRQILLDVLNKLNTYQVKDAEYVAVKENCIFIGFQERKEMDRAKKEFEKDGYKIKRSLTGIKLVSGQARGSGESKASRKKFDNKKASEKKNKGSNKKKDKNTGANLRSANMNADQLVQNQINLPQLVTQMMQQQMVNNMMQNLWNQPNNFLHPAPIPQLQLSNNITNNQKPFSLSDFNVLFYPKNGN